MYDGNFAYVPEATGVGFCIKPLIIIIINNNQKWEIDGDEDIHFPNSDGAGNVLLCNNWLYGTTPYTNGKCVDSLPVSPSVPAEGVQN